jgi:hypothetical protein
VSRGDSTIITCGAGGSGLAVAGLPPAALLRIYTSSLFVFFSLESLSDAGSFGLSFEAPFFYVLPPAPFEFRENFEAS